MSIRIEITKDLLPAIAAQFPQRVSRAIREQVFATEGDAKINITVMGAVDTGNMRASVRGEPISQYEGIVSVSAESEQGYPYPTAVNYGTVHMAARPFWSQAITKAEGDFARRMHGTIEP